MSRETIHCKNCATALQDCYCPHCGQKNIDLERPLLQLVGEVLRETFEVDGRAARTLVALFRRPGLLTAEFLAGRRKLYTSPFRLYLVISVLFFVVAAWIAGQGILLVEGQTDAAGQARFVSNELPRLMFVLLPVFALLLKAAFPRRLYFEHLIHSLHLHSAAYVVLVFLLPLEEAANQYWLFIVAQFAMLTYLLAYFAVSMRRVYRAGWPATAVRVGGVLLGYMVAIAIVFDIVSRLSSAGADGVRFITD